MFICVHLWLKGFEVKYLILLNILFRPQTSRLDHLTHAFGFGFNHLFEMRWRAADQLHPHAEKLVTDIRPREHVIGFAIEFVDNGLWRATARKQPVGGHAFKARQTRRRHRGYAR